MGDTNKSQPIGYEDGGLIRGAFKAYIGGVPYLIKEGKISNPHREDREYGEQGQPEAASYVADFTAMSVTVMARKGLPDPETKRMIPFAFRGKQWVLVATEFSFSTAGLQVYTGEIRKLVNDPVEPIHAE